MSGNVTCEPPFWRNVTDEVILSEVFGSSVATEFRMAPIYWTQPTTARELEEQQTAKPAPSQTVFSSTFGANRRKMSHRVEANERRQFDWTPVPRYPIPPLSKGVSSSSSWSTGRDQVEQASKAGRTANVAGGSGASASAAHRKARSAPPGAAEGTAVNADPIVVELMSTAEAYDIVKNHKSDPNFQSYWWKKLKPAIMRRSLAAKNTPRTSMVDANGAVSRMIGDHASNACGTDDADRPFARPRSFEIVQPVDVNLAAAQAHLSSVLSPLVAGARNAAPSSELVPATGGDIEASSSVENDDRFLATDDSSNDTAIDPFAQTPPPAGTATTSTTPWPGWSYESILSHPQYDEEKIFNYLNPKLHDAQNKKETYLIVEGNEYPLREFRCYGPNGFIYTTTTSTTTTTTRTGTVGSVQMGASIAAANFGRERRKLGDHDVTDADLKFASVSHLKERYTTTIDPDWYLKQAPPQIASPPRVLATSDDENSGPQSLTGTEPPDLEWSNGTTPFCLRERCLSQDDDSDQSLAASGLFECAALNCLQCATFTNMTCTVCLAYTLGQPEFFCMHNDEVCADMRYARPFTDYVEVNGQCPDTEMRLVQGDNTVGVVVTNDTGVAAAPVEYKNVFTPDIFGPKYLPYILGGLSAPFAVFIIFFFYGRYKKMIERMKTFNADGMANPEVANGDFTKLKQFFVEFLEDFLEKSKQTWDEEVKDLQEFAHRSEKCRRQLAVFRKTLRFRRENVISAKHLNLIGKYMKVMPYLCLHLHVDWYDADEKTLAALCNVIRLSFSSESLRLYKIKCRVSFDNDTLKFPPSMNATGRSSVDDIAELLFFNPSINRLKVMNPADIKLERQRLGRNVWYRKYYRRYVAPYADAVFSKKKTRGYDPSAAKISPEDMTDEELALYEEEQHHQRKAELREQSKAGGGGILSSILIGEKPWDPVDLYRLRQITGGRVDSKEMNFGLIGSCCYLGALKALRNLRVLRLRDCNLNDGVVDTLMKLLKRTKLIQLVLSNNYFGDQLVKKMAGFFEDRRASEDLKLFQVDKNMIRGTGFAQWKHDDFDEQITIEEFVLGTEFFGNPLLGDRGVTNLVRALQYEIEQFKFDVVGKSDEEEGEKNLSAVKKLMRKVAKRNAGRLNEDSDPSADTTNKGNKANAEEAPLAKPVKYKFKCLRVLRLCHCRLTVNGSKAVANYICHPSALPLKVLALDGNAVKDAGLEFLMKGFCQRLKIRQGGAHAAQAAQAKKVVTDLDDIDEEEEKRLKEDEADKAFEQAAAGQTSMLDMDITEEYVLHQCERKAVGADPVLEELSLNDCLVTDLSLNMLMIFVRTERLDLVRLGGQNPMSTQMRKDIHKHNMEVARIRNVERGYITTRGCWTSVQSLSIFHRLAFTRTIT
eukprot:g422.t1